MFRQLGVPGICCCPEPSVCFATACESLLRWSHHCELVSVGGCCSDVCCAPFLLPCLNEVHVAAACEWWFNLCQDGIRIDLNHHRVLSKPDSRDAAFVFCRTKRTPRGPLLPCRHAAHLLASHVASPAPEGLASSRIG